MVTAEMWKSLHRLFSYFPRGMLKYDSLSKPPLTKPPKFPYFLVFYFLYFNSYAIGLLSHIPYRIKVVPLSFHVIAIHYVLLFLAASAVIVTEVFAYTVFRSDNYFFCNFNLLCIYQRNEIGSHLSIAIHTICACHKMHF